MSNINQQTFIGTGLNNRISQNLNNVPSIDSRY